MLASGQVSQGMSFMQKLNPHGVRFYYPALGINVKVVLPIRYGGSPTESKTLVLFDFGASSCDHDRARGGDSVCEVSFAQCRALQCSWSMCTWELQ